MGSKFQKRLTGTILLVVLAIIVLPEILDGQKKHYRDELPSIPLLMKQDDYTRN